MHSTWFLQVQEMPKRQKIAEWVQKTCHNNFPVLCCHRKSTDESLTDLPMMHTIRPGRAWKQEQEEYKFLDAYTTRNLCDAKGEMAEFSNTCSLPWEASTKQ